MSINKIMIVGEALDIHAEQAGSAFGGPVRSLLKQMCAQAGINFDECYQTNVFNHVSVKGLDNLTGPKAEGIVGYPAVKSGKYVRAQYAKDLTRLYDEVKREEPNVIIALGPTATWALLQAPAIKKIRGAPVPTSGPITAVVARNIKVVATYHPASIFAEWSLRAIAISDLEKACRESLSPALTRPSREIWIEPSLTDLSDFDRNYIQPSRDLSIDIETAGEHITCVGFAPSVDRCIVVPFTDHRSNTGNYWRSLDDELEAWRWVFHWCSLGIEVPGRPHVNIVGQNFLYDMHRLWRGMGVSVPNTDDTMLLHHALQPEMEKGLGFLASIYTEELPWKFMRTKHETLKKED